MREGFNGDLRPPIRWKLRRHSIAGKGAPAKADAPISDHDLSRVAVMTGSMARLMLRALITVRIRILTDLARTTFRRGILDAWSIVGHGGCECGSTDRERRCGKGRADLAIPRNPFNINGWWRRGWELKVIDRKGKFGLFERQGTGRCTDGGQLP